MAQRPWPERTTSVRRADVPRSGPCSPWFAASAVAKRRGRTHTETHTETTDPGPRRPTPARAPGQAGPSQRGWMRRRHDEAPTRAKRPETPEIDESPRCPRGPDPICHPDPVCPEAGCGTILRTMPVVDAAALVRERVDAIRNYHHETGIDRAELDVSGGVDSAAMLGLLARAIGPARITAAYLGIHSSDGALTRAREAANAFDVPLVEIDLTAAFDATLRAMRASLSAAGFDDAAIDARCAADGTVLGSFRSCFRAPVGRGLNRLTGGGIRHGTGNECEDRFIRFYQKGGDGEVDSNPIAMLAKGEVYQLARALGVPRSILDATPTPDLQGIGDVHNDEDELRELTGVSWTYSRIDADTGDYTKVGTIESMSRFLDSIDDGLFSPRASDLDRFVAPARRFFPGADDATIRGLLQSARTLEASSRHKSNPNCPTLGSRLTLLREGLVTNDLPRVSGISRPSG
ncbi:MAG: hypothetical protein B7733_19770 [Myxococcales bacterium FL481]|nr:MAG: hypothetical protein B7733_19770 [Myxococcales bacterium FL481]